MRVRGGARVRGGGAEWGKVWSVSHVSHNHSHRV